MSAAVHPTLSSARTTPDAALLPDASLAALRVATRAHHAAIDALLAPQLAGSRAAYGRIVQGFEAFLARWEQLVHAALPPHLRPWAAARSRRHLAAADLQALGLPTVQAQPLRLQLCGAGAALGSLYVMEGSALGGQLIARQAARRWQMAPGSGCAYFHGFGPATGAMWREFQALLCTEMPARELQAACDAACSTFDALAGLMHHLLDVERPA